MRARARASSGTGSDGLIWVSAVRIDFRLNSPSHFVAMRPHYTPRLKKRTALLGKLKEIFRRYVSQPLEQVITLINPILRGWVNYCAVGDSGRSFSL